MTKGIGYQEYKDLRRLEGLSSTEIEEAGNERFLIYFGRTHLTDFLSGRNASGPMKIGRGKFATAIMRGRNQGGADFRIHGEIILECNEATNVLERLVEQVCLTRRIVNTAQGQSELYDYKDDELIDVMTLIISAIENHSSYYIVEANTYDDNKQTELLFERNSAKLAGYVPQVNSTFDAMFS